MVGDSVKRGLAVMVVVREGGEDASALPAVVDFENGNEDRLFVECPKRGHSERICIRRKQWKVVFECEWRVGVEQVDGIAHQHADS